jgi:hypothetical protein
MRRRFSSIGAHVTSAAGKGGLPEAYSARDGARQLGQAAPALEIGRPGADQLGLCSRSRWPAVSIASGA